MKNERGSLPLVVIIIFTLGIAVLALTQLLLSETLTAKAIVKKQLDNFYEEDMVIEIVNNLFLQKTMNKEWDGELGDETFITMNDLIEIEEIVNKTILPSENSELQIITSDLYSDRLDAYCEEVYEEGTGIDTELYFVGYNCARLPTDVEFTLTILEDGNSSSFRLIFEDFYPSVTRTEDGIVIDKSELVTDISPN